MASTRTRGRPRAFDREAALDRAIRLFWHKGYEATSVRDLGRELGIGQPSLYGTFGGKRELFREAVEVYRRHYGGFIDAALEEEPTATLVMQRLFAQAPERYTRRGLPRGCLLASGDAGSSDGEVRTLLSRIRREKMRRLGDRIRADMDAGLLPGDIDAAALSGYVMTVLEGMAQRARDGEGRAELEGISRIANRAVQQASTG